MFSFFNNIKENYKSGLSVAIVAIPLSIPLAVASGATPLQGILTAIWAGLFASFFAGSKFNIIGPAGALSALLLAFAATNGPQYLPILALVVGVYVLAIYFLRITRYIMLIPSTALHGFIMGVGLVISATQLNNALGLVGLPKHEGFLQNFLETLRHVPDANLMAVGLFVAAFGLILLLKKVLKSVPPVIPVSILGILFGYLTKSGYIHMDFKTLGDLFPDLSFKALDLSTRSLFTQSDLIKDATLIRNILSSGLVVAIVALLETLISAKVADKVTKSKFVQGKEIFALAIANLASGFAGGLPASGVFVRTAVNFKSGATSAWSQGLHAAFVFIISRLLFSYFKFLPMPVVAAVLMNVALGMIDVNLMKKIFHYSSTSLIVLIVVAVITLVEDPIIGIITGTAISLLMYIKNSSAGHLYSTIFRKKEFLGKMRLSQYLPQQEDGDIVICKFAGEINFINVTAELEQLAKLEKKVKVVFSFGHISDIDIDGIEALEDVVEHLEKHHIEFYFSGVEGTLHDMLMKTHYYTKLVHEGKTAHSSSHILKQFGLS